MFQSYNLQPVTVHDKPLVFEWDADTGAVRGRDAQRVQAMAREANARGTVTGQPFPTAYAVSDALHDKGQMAVVLGNYWRLSDDLLDAYPVPDENPGDADGVIY